MNRISVRTGPELYAGRETAASRARSASARSSRASRGLSGTAVHLVRSRPRAGPDASRGRSPAGARPPPAAPAAGASLPNHT